MSLQIENGGYTRIVNEVLDQLVKTPLLGSELSLILFVIRKTWGFNKREDVISFTQFEKALNLSRPTVSKTLTNLVKRRILVKGALLGKQGIPYRFNKYYSEWLVNPPQLVKDTSPTSKEKLVQLVKGGLHTKDNTKENKRGYEKFLKQRERLISSKIL